MIQIQPGKTAARPNVPHDPYKYWDDYFKKHEESPKDLLETVAILQRENKTTDVEACVRGYLGNPKKNSKKWKATTLMYLMVAVAIENRKGSPEEVKNAIGFAAYIAAESKDPGDLLNVADTLHRRGIYDKVGPAKISAGDMIDNATKLIPHRIEPLLMSILVAQKTKDPVRMADASERILSLGWPGNDDQMRRDVRTQVDALAKLLKEDGRAQDAETLQGKLTTSMTRDVYVRLSWEGVDDIDLLVDEPLGTTAQLFKTPRTILGGAIVTNGFGKHPQEIYVCPRGFTGKYTVRIDKIYQPEKNPATVANLEIITHEGMPDETRETHKIDLEKPLPLTFRLENGRRKEVLPFISPPEEVAPAAEPAKGPVAKPATPKAPAIKPD